ncbi:MAG: three-Cys-motif partner protein TcmP, partial [Fibrobacterota bacterium]
MADFHLKGFDEATIIKLDVFRGYIREWLSIFMTRPGYVTGDYKAELSIFDFFSGPGFDSNNNPGSPVIIAEEIRSYCESREDFRAVVQVCLFFNDANSDHIESLKENIGSVACEKSCCKYLYSSKTFSKVFQKYLPMLKNTTSAKLVIMDQFGLKEVTPDILKFLAECRKTDVLFFISSSFVKRFIETPEIGSKFNLDIAKVKNAEYNAIHQLVCSHFRDEINSDDYFLAPFSLKKGANIYGIIFGSSSLYGLEKFLQVCWKIDSQTGEANYSIEKEKYWHGQQSLFPEENSFKKIDLFKNELLEFLNKAQTNNETYRFTLLKGFPPSKANEVLRDLQNNGKIETSTIPDSMPGRKGSFYLGHKH